MLVPCFFAYGQDQLARSQDQVLSIEAQRQSVVPKQVCLEDSSASQSLPQSSHLPGFTGVQYSWGDAWSSL